MAKLRVNIEKNKAPNYAEDRDFALKLAEENATDWNYTRAQRSEREVRFQDYYDMWNVGNQDPLNLNNYMGRANLHLPQVRKEVETMTRRLQKAFFPEDYLKASPELVNVDEDIAMANAMLVRHYFDKVTCLKKKSHPWIKQGVLYGTSPLRSYWRREVNEVFFKKRYYDVGEGGALIPNVKKVKELVKLYDAPDVCTADIFQTWVYPVTAATPDEIQKVFHRRKIKLSDIEQMIKDGICVEKMDGGVDTMTYFEDLAKEKDEQYDQTQQRFQALGESGELQGHREGRLLDLYEIWGKAEIDGKMMSYVQYVIGNSAGMSAEACIRIQQNPYWHQTPNFDWMRYIIAPGNEFYGRGLPEAVQFLQHQLDDVLNQGMDSNTLALNQITIVNPAFAPNVESFEIEPNAIWWADPSAVKNFQFPDLNEVTMKSSSMLRTIITEMSDNSPQLPDPLSGKARSTGQADLAMSEWQTDLYSFVDQIIQEALIPLADKFHLMLQDKIDDDSIIRITGRYAGSWINRYVTNDDIFGRMKFSWMGAVQIQNESVRTQQMLQFLKIIPMLPPEDRAKIDINYQGIMTRLLKNGFNVSDPEELVSSESDNMSIPPWIEGKLMLQGSIVKINKHDDDDGHIRQHFIDMKKAKDPAQAAIFDQHQRWHLAQKQQKAEAAMQAQQQQELQQQAQVAVLQKTAATGDPPGQAKPPHGAGNKSGIIQPGKGPNPNGNQGQIPSSTNVNDMAKGVRP